jgi:transposase
MEIDFEDLARRLVVGHKRDGRGIYDPAAKQELVDLCRRTGSSVAKLARDFGINANLLASWLRDSERKAGEVVESEPANGSPSAAFVAVHLESAAPTLAAAALVSSLQARLPNGVVLDLQCDDAQQLGKLIEALGRVRCSALTKT